MFYGSRFKAFDLQKDQLLDLQDLPFQIFSPSSFLLDGMPFIGSSVCVDIDDRKRLVTKLSRLTDNESKWSEFTMIERQYASITNFLGAIVATGGRDLEHDDPLNRVDMCYPNCKSQEWLPLPPMKYNRHLHGTCATGNKLFAVGGFNNLTAEMLTYL